VKLTTRSEYALLALIHLARHEGEEYVPVAVIAEAQAVPHRFLEQLLLVLKRGRLVKSQKGQRGGYRLGRAPEKISLAEVIRLLDGALAPTESVSTYFYEPTPVEREKRLLRVFQEIRDLVSNKLEKTTLADVR
jgi:Rrf2 family transcriptional regulator, cysteine metabolism repressor